MIKLICVGKIKEAYFASAIQEYQKRLSRYTKLELIEVPDVNLGTVETILEREKDYIYRHLNDKDYVITLEIEGQEMDSLMFASTLENLEMMYGNVAFIIGGSYGLHEQIKKRAQSHLSFSKMTFPHQLFRILLLEQLYRAYKIKHHETYHK